MSLLGAKTRVQALWSLVQDMRLSGGHQRDYKKKEEKRHPTGLLDRYSLVHLDFTSRHSDPSRDGGLNQSADGHIQEGQEEKQKKRRGCSRLK
ncbi:hypothetical protein OUZ56_019339 [Daphnia magna]|uniref:Uncharacterized protein n=1 Tax=Daphnia magna TaxID=35525 RepID=A0ABQ9ZBA2_9CRUS|nr:hypothetical protein OUZ56_019339 [Daphnia magna]